MRSDPLVLLPLKPLLPDLAVSLPPNPLPLEAELAPRVEKKCWFCETFRVVEAAAERPLAEKLSRLGLTGNLPVEKLALWN